MNAEEIRDYCLNKDDTTEGFPFGPTALVFKTNNKMFALLAIDAIPLSINLKCDPEKALQLREQFPNVLPGYHMNKKHWNTVVIEPPVTPDLLHEWIDHSYSLVHKKPKTRKTK